MVIIVVLICDVILLLLHIAHCGGVYCVMSIKV